MINTVIQTRASIFSNSEIDNNNYVDADTGDDRQAPACISKTLPVGSGPHIL